MHAFVAAASHVASAAATAAEEVPVWLTVQQLLDAGCSSPAGHSLLLCSFFNGLDSCMQTQCLSFVAVGGAFSPLFFFALLLFLYLRLRHHVALRVCLASSFAWLVFLLVCLFVCLFCLLLVLSVARFVCCFPFACVYACCFLFLFVFCLQACSFIHVPLCPFVCSSVFNSPMTLQRLALLLFVVLLLLQQQRLRFRMDSRAPWVQYVPVHIRLLIVFI